MGFALAFGALASSAAYAQITADGDKDGVADTLDDCPYTPSGAKVDNTGCALDQDFDGVADGLDRCTSTPLGAVVDADGCAKSQIAVTAPAAPVAPPEPPPSIITTPVGIDPFSTRAPEPVAPPAPMAPPAPIQAYPIAEAPTPGQVSSGAVPVPAPAPFPSVPDQVRAELDGTPSSPSGKTVINLPVLRDPAQPPPPLAFETAAPAPIVADMPAAPSQPVAEAAAAVPPAPEVKYIAEPVYLYQRQIKTAAPRLSTTPVTPLEPRVVIPPSSYTPSPSPSAPAPAATLASGSGMPVDPFSTPLTLPVLKTEWSMIIGDGGQMDAVAEQELRVAADAIKQAQRENPSLNYEVAGSVNTASNAMSFLATQGVAISRLHLKATGATDGKVVIRPASE